MSTSTAPMSFAFDLSAKRSCVEDQARKICGQTVPGWAENESELDVTKLATGLTNVNFKVRNNKTDAQVIVRVYGCGLNIDREAEHGWLEAFQHVHGSFTNGIVYSYIPGAPITEEQLQRPEIRTAVARQIARYHKHAAVSRWGTAAPKTQQTVFKLAENWSKEALLIEQTLLEENNSKLTVQQKQMLRDINLTKQTDFLFGILQHLKKQSGLQSSFCHNDLTFGNILVDVVDEDNAKFKVKFIDFEYQDWNYSLFDIANHLCEWMLVTVDSTKFPSRSVQEDYVKAYCEEYEQRELSASELEDYMSTTIKLCLCSSVLWCYWGILQLHSSPIEWDYLGYSYKRVQAIPVIQQYHK